MQPLLLAQNARMPSLQDTVVTATRTEQPLADLVADVSIIDRETIEASGATGLADMLARLPGVEITRNGGIGNATSVYLRGAESGFTAVYIDGVRVDCSPRAAPSGSRSRWRRSSASRCCAARRPRSMARTPSAAWCNCSRARAKARPCLMWVSAWAAREHASSKPASAVRRIGPDGALDYALGLTHAQQRFRLKPAAPHNADRDGYRSTSGHARLGYRIDARHKLDATLLASRMNSAYDGFAHTRQPGGRPQPQPHAHGRAELVGAVDRRLQHPRVGHGFGQPQETSPSPYRRMKPGCAATFGRTNTAWAHRFSAALERREDHLTNAPSTRAVRRMRWRWATATNGVPHRCNSTCATTMTANSVAKARAVWPMATPLHRRGVSPPRRARPSARPYALPALQ